MSRRRAEGGSLLRLLEGMAFEQEQIVHVHSLPEREARHQDPAEPLSEPIQRGLAEQGIERLYLHQASALDAVRRGENLLAVTGTASGKSLCYTLPVLEGLLDDPEARALYLFPTKALAQDQLKALKRWLPEDAEVLEPGRRRARPRHLAEGDLYFRAGTYDGDTPTTLRQRLRDEANILLTNPDMLHSGILPNHARWAEFFTRLRYIVIDEVHVYRGIFGSQVANVLRRLARIYRHYDAEPIWIGASATIGNPGELAERLTGRPFTVVDDDGSPRGRKHFVLWNPPASERRGLERKSSNLEARDLFVRLLREGYQVIAFVKARLLTEVMLRYCQEQLRHDGGGLAAKIRSYRAGYLPEERRRIEAALFEGALLGVISTNALELGIDVGGLDVAILVGYPGTIASTWQQAGRAGRRQDESAAILVGHNAPIDQYLMANPDYFFGRSPEGAVLDAGNPHILMNHLRCAALEIPITREEETGFGEYAPAILDLLTDSKLLTAIKGRWFYAKGDHPAAAFSLRNTGANVYTIVDTTSGQNRVIGTIDEPSAFHQVHPQAVYMHEGETYFVDTLDLSERAAYVHRAELDHYTQAVTDSHIDAEEPELNRVVRQADVAFGECRVHEKVTMFKKIQFGGRDSLGYGQVDLPHTTLHTTAMWFTPTSLALRKVLDQGRVPADGLAGVANVLAEIVALRVMCDSLDLGSVIDMRNVSGPTLYLYDKYPGGLGYAQRAYHLFEDLLPEALRLISGCGCEEGCPSCVGSPIVPQYQQDPDAAMKGRIPDKEAAKVLLHALLELPDYHPKVPLEGFRRERARRYAEAKAAELADPGASTPAAPKRAPRARVPATATGGGSPRDVRPLPPDLREKLLAQLARQEESGERRRIANKPPESPANPGPSPA